MIILGGIWSYLPGIAAFVIAGGSYSFGRISASRRRKAAVISALEVGEQDLEIIKTSDVETPAKPFDFSDVKSAGSISDQELDFVATLIAGKTKKEIAAQLSMSPATVEVLCTRILRKLEIKNRAEAARLADKLGVSLREKR